MQPFVVALVVAGGLVAGGPSGGIPAPAPPVDPAPVVRALGESPVDRLLGPLPVPAVETPGNPAERPILDLVDRPRTGRRLPSIPTAVPGGRGDPFPGLTGGGYAAYTTGTAYHTDGLLGAQGQTADVDLGFAGAVFASTALTARFD